MTSADKDLLMKLIIEKLRAVVEKVYLDETGNGGCRQEVLELSRILDETILEYYRKGKG